ncbi:uncharacterized protein [Haliotis asinina]|uniref:uncharacterized protein n=1 Tax=Haliotis asinina TaxID=109174 RepID=UPI003531AFC2
MCQAVVRKILTRLLLEDHPCLSKKRFVECGGTGVMISVDKKPERKCHTEQQQKKKQQKTPPKIPKRMKSKIALRMKSLKTIDWPDRRKERVSTILTLEMTSPVVSDEEDANLLISYPFTWESKLKTSALDSATIFNATTKAKANMKTRMRHPTRMTEISAEGCPSGLVNS